MRLLVLLVCLLAPAAAAQSVPEWWLEPTPYGGLWGGIAGLALGMKAVGALDDPIGPWQEAVVLAAVPVGMAAGTVVVGRLAGRDGAPLGALQGALVGLAPGALMVVVALHAEALPLEVSVPLALVGTAAAAGLGPVGAAIGYEGGRGRLTLLPVSDGRRGTGLSLHVGL